jgi:uncharacterized membrane protein YfcA
MSIAVVGGTSLIGSVVQYLRGHFHVQATLLYIPTGMAGAYLGAGLTHLLPPAVLLLLFAGLMLVVGGIMLRGRRATEGTGVCRPLRCLMMGAAVGVLTGFLGVGGGFLLVPTLVLFAGLEMRSAVGSSLAIIALNSLAGLVGQLRYTALDWGLTTGFLGVALIGMGLGLALAGRIPEHTLRQLFAGLVLAVACVLLITNVTALIRS